MLTHSKLAISMVILYVWLFLYTPYEACLQPFYHALPNCNLSRISCPFFSTPSLTRRGAPSHIGIAHGLRCLHGRFILALLQEIINKQRPDNDPSIGRTLPFTFREILRFKKMRIYFKHPEALRLKLACIYFV